MTREEIKKAILNATGNPESGVIKDSLGVIADAILKALEPEEVKAFEPVKETRIVRSSETR